MKSQRTFEIVGTVERVFRNTTGTGKQVANLTVSYPIKGKDAYQRVVLWDDLAEQFGNVAEGSGILISGYPKIASFTNKEGVEKTYIEMIGTSAKQVRIDKDMGDGLTQNDDIPF